MSMPQCFNAFNHDLIIIFTEMILKMGIDRMQTYMPNGLCLKLDTTIRKDLYSIYLQLYYLTYAS